MLYYNTKDDEDSKVVGCCWIVVGAVRGRYDHSDNGSYYYYIILDKCYILYVYMLCMQWGDISTYTFIIIKFSLSILQVDVIMEALAINCATNCTMACMSARVHTDIN